MAPSKLNHRPFSKFSLQFTNISTCFEFSIYTYPTSKVFTATYSKPPTTQPLYFTCAKLTCITNVESAYTKSAQCQDRDNKGSALKV